VASPLAAIALTEPIHVPELTVMEVHIKPETESRLTELASKSGRATDDLVEDAHERDFVLLGASSSVWDCRLIRRPAKDARRKSETCFGRVTRKGVGHQKVAVPGELIMVASFLRNVTLRSPALASPSFMFLHVVDFKGVRAG
jgi:hypothetical protein